MCDVRGSEGMDWWKGGWMRRRGGKMIEKKWGDGWDEMSGKE